ncbi:hypothetical protein F5Y19DRAFT_470158 [Xylariaceae sp. FL1651]|nr:hypothetical protein F5Y19DRAFT_470158 [Xylariaceae sp. FL1651]
MNYMGSNKSGNSEVISEKDLDRGEQQKELFDFYFDPNTKPNPLQTNKNLNLASKAEAMDTISYALEINKKNQAPVFRYIREFMDRGFLAGSRYSNKYACPSYYGKCWINCFLQATQNRKLPKSVEVDRVAVINV